MAEMNPKILKLMKQAAEEGELTCPKCGAKLEIKADKCGSCGWKNPLKDWGAV